MSEPLTTPIYYSRITIVPAKKVLKWSNPSKSKKAASTKHDWKEITVELIYKMRNVDDNKDTYLMSRIRTLAKLKPNEQFRIKSIKHIKYIGEGKNEIE